MQQGELLQFLVGGQQVALDLVGQPGQRLGVRRVALAFQPGGDPVRQRRARDGRDLGPDGAGFQGLDPLGLLGGPVQLRQADQDPHVRQMSVAGHRRQLLQGVGPGLARLAGGQADFQQAQVAEQGRVLRGRQRCAPVAAGVHHQVGAFDAAQPDGGGAVGVGRLGQQQDLVAAQDRAGRQFLCAGVVLGQAVRGRRACHGLGPVHARAGSRPGRPGGMRRGSCRRAWARRGGRRRWRRRPGLRASSCGAGSGRSGRCACP
ncbi:hypothetical protein CDEN61S_03520 [Castellaniella denitrificans]